MVKISVITVCYNNAEGLARTLQSVAAQSHKDLEYIVIDGGSKDGTRELLEQRNADITYWVSEPDKGIYHAMNKGILKASCDYLLFLNSGDIFRYNDAIADAAVQMEDHDLVYADLELKSENESEIRVYPKQLSFRHFLSHSLPHPATFIKKALFDRYGLYDETLKICSDWAFFINMVCRYNVSYKKIGIILSVFYLDGISSSASYIRLIADERAAVLEKDFPMFTGLTAELMKAEALREHIAASRFIKLGKRMGFLKHL